MTIADINSFVTFKTGQDTTSYSAANRLLSTNRWYHKAQSILLESDSTVDFHDTNSSTEPVITKNLTANQGYVQLSLTDNIIKIKKALVTYDGTNWYKAEQFDPGQSSDALITQAEINSKFSTTTPFYKVKGLFVYLYPVPTANVTGGLKLLCDIEIDEFTSGQVTTGTKVPGFDKAFHPYIALGMIFDWYDSKPNLADKAAATLTEINEYELRMRRRMGDKGEDSPLTLLPAYENYN